MAWRICTEGQYKIFSKNLHDLQKSSMQPTSGGPDPPPPDSYALGSARPRKTKTAPLITLPGVSR